MIYDATETYFNTYTGGAFQQATSSVSFTGEFLRQHREFRIDMGEDQNCDQLETGCFAVYGFEYKPGEAFISLAYLPQQLMKYFLGYDDGVSTFQADI